MSRHWMCAAVLIAVTAVCQTPAAARRVPDQQINPTAASKAAATSKFKAVFEPVNYSQDLRLNDVGFATEDIGWVPGDAGSILYTNTVPRMIAAPMMPAAAGSSSR